VTSSGLIGTIAAAPPPRALSIDPKPNDDPEAFFSGVALLSGLGVLGREEAGEPVARVRPVEEVGVEVPRDWLRESGELVRGMTPREAEWTIPGRVVGVSTRM